jgi:regulator of cell morphogenesis and NO signaling
MNFTGDTKVKDIALSHPAARRVLESAGLDYCCRGAKSLRDACLHSETSPDEILRRLHEAPCESVTEYETWLDAPLGDLTRHIVERHHAYVRESIPRTQALLDKVSDKHGPNHPELQTIRRAFAAVAAEMIAHMQKEERILFPYIEALQASVVSGRPVEHPFFGTVKNPIQAMMKDHDASSEHLKHIRVLTGNYTAPPSACTSFKALYQALLEFESDLHHHIHLENNLLFPRAVELEAAFA